MTSYVAQSLIFFPLFWMLSRAGVLDQIGPAAAAGIAVVTWCAVVSVAYTLAVRGQRGPLETAMRHLVAKTERRRPVVAPGAPTTPGEGGSGQV